MDKSLDNMSMEKLTEHHKSMKSYFKELLVSGKLKSDLHHKNYLSYVLSRVLNGDATEEKLDFVVNKFTFMLCCNTKESFNTTHLLPNASEKELSLSHSSTSTSCSVCGKYCSLVLKEGTFLETSYSDDNPRVLTYENSDSCFNLREYSIELDFPTGDLVFCDWLRLSENIIDFRDDEDINSIRGSYIRSMNYATHNIGHFFVSNTSPSIVEKDGLLYAGFNKYTDFDDENVDEDADEIEYAVLPGSVDLGSICTDLWALTFFDEKTILDLIDNNYPSKSSELKAEFDEVKRGWTFVRHKVEPGRYRATYYVEPVEAMSFFTDVTSDSLVVVKLEKI